MTEFEDASQSDCSLLLDALDSMEEALVAYDAEGKLTLCNKAFREMYSYTAEQTRPGVHFRELGEIDVRQGNVVVEDEDGNDYLKRKAAYRRSLVGSFTVKLRDERWIRTTDCRMSNGGFVSVHVDITEIKRVEENLRKASKASRAKSEFLANMSHELRTPLNAIIGFSSSMKSETFGPLNEKYVEYVNDINSSGEHLLELISDILDVSAIEASKLELHEENLNVGKVVTATMRMVNGRADDGNIRLTSKLDDGLPMLHADRRRLMQILLNLLSNAIKFTPPDGEVELTASLDGGDAHVFTVTDTGIGMDEEELAKAMSEFGQVDSSLSRKHEGTGIGLSLTQGLIELHDGTLEIESEKGKGTTATVRFPPERTVVS